MIRTPLFWSNGSQTVLLPEDMAFPDDVREVVILRDGDRRVIVPADRSWDEFFATPGMDLEERLQLEPQERQSL